MAQVPLLNGIYTDQNADFRTSYPINLIPVPKETGISKGYLLAAPGITAFGAGGPGIDRGAIFYDGACIRVSGGQLVRVSEFGTVTALGAIAGGEPAAMAYSTDRLCVVGGGCAYYLQGSTLRQITNVNVGSPIDVIWVDGYFMFTDGSFIYVTELTDPYTVDPTKYAASEIDPDAITGLLKYRNEVYVFNRYTIEVFDNVGGSGFPFTRLPGGLIPKGCVGPAAKTLFAETFAWVGNSSADEGVSVWMANGSTAVKIATREVETALSKYSEAQLRGILVESKADKLHQHLYLHLPEETLVYDAAASVATGEPVWFYMGTGEDGLQPYRGRHFLNAYGKWIVGDSEDGRLGYIDDSVSTQYDEIAGWRFDTLLVYNDSKSAIVHELELVGTTGRAAIDESPTVFRSYTLDGQTWSDEKQASMGNSGATQARVCWRRCGKMRQFRGERFRGANRTRISWARLEADFEGLNA